MGSKLNAFAHPPFNVVESIADYMVLRDDFIGGGLTTGTIGELRWDLADLQDGVPVLSHVAGEAAHPGILRLSTGNTTPASGDGFAMDLTNADAIVLGAGNGFYAALIVRFVTDMTGKEFRFGLRDDATNARPNSGAVFEYDHSANPDVFASFVQQGGSGGAAIVSAVPAVHSTWYKLEMVADDLQVQFFVDGVLIGEHTADIPTDAMTPVVTLKTEANVEEFVEIDAFMLRAVIAR